MHKELDQITKERIIDQAIRNIDEKGGALHVNLRGIAREIGCSAPNMYNYFQCMDDLLNMALIKICLDFVTEIRQKTAGADQTEDFEELAFRVYLEYILDYPGRMNFYHFERLNFEISSEAQNSAQMVGEHMAGLLYKCLGQTLSYEKVLLLTGFLHKFILGTVSNYITGREKIENKERYVADLTGVCRKILKSLAADFSWEQEACHD